VACGSRLNGPTGCCIVPPLDTPCHFQPTCVGETHGPRGGGVSAGVPGVWWRHPVQSGRPATEAGAREGDWRVSEGASSFPGSLAGNA
jgi:hypothetical protein